MIIRSETRTKSARELASVRLEWNGLIQNDRLEWAVQTRFEVAAIWILAPTNSCLLDTQYQCVLHF